MQTSLTFEVTLRIFFFQKKGRQLKWDVTAGLYGRVPRATDGTSVSGDVGIFVWLESEEPNSAGTTTLSVEMLGFDSILPMPTLLKSL